MKKITVTVGSVTYAIKLRRYLTRAGISSRLIKVDNTTDKRGCSHGVEISGKDLYNTIVIMKENNVEYSVYEND